MSSIFLSPSCRQGKFVGVTEKEIAPRLKGGESVSASQGYNKRVNKTAAGVAKRKTKACCCLGWIPGGDQAWVHCAVTPSAMLFVIDRQRCPGRWQDYFTGICRAAIERMM